MSNSLLLKTSELRTGYGSKPVLQGVNFQVKQGEILAVIGRNGVGKSTLMKSLIGLLPTGTGDIHFAGKSIAHLPSFKRARLGIGYVPQGRDVFPRMSVEENLKVGESLSNKVATSKYDEIYSYFPILAERRKQAAGTLSGGQQQQLAIGRVLIASPSLILLDEPSEGIQPSIVKDIARLMVKLNQSQGLTVVFVEQNLEMIQSMAQRCYVMDKGQFTEELDPSELHDPKVVKRCLSI
ncbi:ABC transporter ATP-binding protein [Paenalcaligenes niemegkensis]|uniref:ABC transporter ATP-binding protein n=1 Tax=Paenalcaligenes niemegkensis TaxID=2895469 RepID=UPI001EE89DD0|nr:ABC transporter ATP-binding protein [Paenalcaligenes niemegkensis]MCQ9617416.1 ABC transporter ATP-binding protein [Paenalcaligenes niemegkensis]